MEMLVIPRKVEPNCSINEPPNENLIKFANWACVR